MKSIKLSTILYAAIFFLIVVAVSSLIVSFMPSIVKTC